MWKNYVWHIVEPPGPPECHVLFEWPLNQNVSKIFPIGLPLTFKQNVLKIEKVSAGELNYENVASSTYRQYHHL